jgi:hypothetical protein
MSNLLLAITGVWGTGDLSEKPVGFLDVRAKVSFEADRPRAEHVNKFLDQQPEQFEEKLRELETEIDRLATTPFETDPAYWRAVIEARLAASEACLAAAQAAMVHCGARGYVTTGAAQRQQQQHPLVG